MQISGNNINVKVIPCTHYLNTYKQRNVKMIKIKLVKKKKISLKRVHEEIQLSIPLLQTWQLLRGGRERQELGSFH